MISVTLYPWAAGLLFGVLLWPIMLVITALFITSDDDDRQDVWGCIRWTVYSGFFFSFAVSVTHSLGG